MPYSDHLVRSMGRPYATANDSVLRLAFREMNPSEVSLEVEMGIINLVWNALDESLKSWVRHMVTESTSVAPLLLRCNAISVGITKCPMTKGKQNIWGSATIWQTVAWIIQ
jgi:hypothetical protein